MSEEKKMTTETAIKQESKKFTERKISYKFTTIDSESAFAKNDVDLIFTNMGATADKMSESIPAKKRRKTYLNSKVLAGSSISAAKKPGLIQTKLSRFHCCLTDTSCFFQQKAFAKQTLSLSTDGMNLKLMHRRPGNRTECHLYLPEKTQIHSWQ